MYIYIYIYDDDDCGDGGDDYNNNAGDLTHMYIHLYI
jgi:hypothetical protein